MYKTSLLIALIAASAKAIEVGLPLYAQTAEEDGEELGVNHGMEVAAATTNKVHDLTECYKMWNQAHTRYENKIENGQDD